MPGPGIITTGTYRDNYKPGLTGIRRNRDLPGPGIIMTGTYRDKEEPGLTGTGNNRDRDLPGPGIIMITETCRDVLVSMALEMCSETPVTCGLAAEWDHRITKLEFQS